MLVIGASGYCVAAIGFPIPLKGAKSIAIPEAFRVQMFTPVVRRLWIGREPLNFYDILTDYEVVDDRPAIVQAEHERVIPVAAGQIVHAHVDKCRKRVGRDEPVVSCTTIQVVLYRKKNRDPARLRPRGCRCPLHLTPSTLKPDRAESCCLRHRSTGRRQGRHRASCRALLDRWERPRLCRRLLLRIGGSV